MSRPLRIEFPDALYHVTARGARRENLFDDDEDQRVFLDTLFPGRHAVQLALLRLVSDGQPLPPADRRALWGAFHDGGAGGAAPSLMISGVAWRPIAGPPAPGHRVWTSQSVAESPWAILRSPGR